MNKINSFTVKSANLGDVQVTHRDCPLCGRNNDDVPDHKLSYDVWTIKQCPECDFVYIDRGPDYEKLFTDLSWEVTSKIEETRRADLRPVSYRASKATRIRMALLPRKNIHEMVTNWVSEGNVVDLGCGEGTVPGTYGPSFTPYGVEISTELATTANNNLSASGGGCINAPTLEGLKTFPDNFFSAATLRSYLEHESNPLPVLQEVFRTLRPGGVAIVKVPNFASINRAVMGSKWCGLRFPDHLNYFTPKTLKKMANKAGFVVKTGLTYKLPTSDNMYAVLLKPNE